MKNYLIEYIINNHDQKCKIKICLTLGIAPYFFFTIFSQLY